MTMPIPDGSVVITPAQMYQQIGDLANEVRELRGVVDPALSELRTDVKDHTTMLNSHGGKLVRVGTRLTIIETKLKVIGWLLGVVVIPGIAAVAAVLGVIH